MTPAILVSLTLIIGGLVAYAPTSGRFMRDFQGRYRRVPTRLWMLRSVDDPEIERWRRYAAASLLVNVVGAMLLFANTAAR